MRGSSVNRMLFTGRVKHLSVCEVDHTLSPDPLKTPDSPPSSLAVHIRDGTTSNVAAKAFSLERKTVGICATCWHDNWKCKEGLPVAACFDELCGCMHISHLEQPPCLFNDDTTCSSQCLSKPETLTQDFCCVDECSEPEGSFDVNATFGDFVDDVGASKEHEEISFSPSDEVWVKGGFGEEGSPEGYNFNGATTRGGLHSHGTEDSNSSEGRKRGLTANGPCGIKESVSFVYPCVPPADSIQLLTASQSCLSEQSTLVGKPYRIAEASLCRWFVCLYLHFRKVVNFALHLEEKALHLIGKAPPPYTQKSNSPFSAPLWRLREARWRHSRTSVCVSEAVGTFTLTLILYASGVASAAASIGKAVDVDRGLNMFLLGGRLPLLIYVFSSSVGLHFNPALLYASYVASPTSRNLAFTNLLALHQYLAAAAAAAVAWIFCGGSGLVANAFRPPPHRSLLQLAFAEATAAFLVCLASFHLRQLLSKLARAFHGEERPLSWEPARCSYMQEVYNDNASRMEAEGFPSEAESNRSFSHHTFRASALLILLLILLILHTPSPTALNPAVAYTAAWLARADEGFLASAPSWQGAYSWLQYFLLFSFAPYTGSQAASIIWSRYYPK